MPWTNQAVILFVLIEPKSGFSGIFVYSPGFAAGDLTASMAAVTGQDPKGNHYLPLIAAYAPPNAAQLNGDGVAWYSGSEAAGWTGRASLVLDSIHPTFMRLSLGGPSPQGVVAIIGPSGDSTGATDGAAINYAFGLGFLQVQLLPGTYHTAAPVLMPPAGVLTGPAGSWANTGGQGTPATPPCIIKAVAGFTGDGMIVVEDQVLGGYASQTTDVQIRGLTLDGSAASGNVAGIYLHGPVWGTTLADVCVYAVPGDGIQTAGDAANYPSGQNAPYGIHAARVKIDSCGGAGIVAGNATDCIWEHVQVIGCTGNGWNFDTGGDHRLVSCSAENGGAIGFDIGMGGVQMTSCRTNSNTSHGVSVNSGTAGQGPVTLTNCRLVSDGTNGTSFGLNVNNPANGLHVSDSYIGPIEIGSATPATALNLQGTPPYVLLAGSLFWGETASGIPAVPASWLRLRAVMAATGPTAAPVYTAVPDAN